MARGKAKGKSKDKPTGISTGGGSTPRFSGFADAAAEASKNFPDRSVVEFIPTGDILWDWMLGGGLPRGRIIELSSEPGVGKTTTALDWMRNACSLGFNGAYLDFENAMITSLQDGVGISEYIGKHYVLNTGQTWDDLNSLMRMYLDKSAGVDIIVLDSITSVLPTQLLGEDITPESVRPGLNARCQSNFFQMFKAPIADAGVVFILVNQARVFIDMKNANNCRLQGAGGYALKHYSDLRFFLKNTGTIKDEADNEIGASVAAVSVKNKICGFRRGIYQVAYGKGVDKNATVAEYFKRTAGCVGSGAWFTINIRGEEKKVHGNKGVAEYVSENYDVVCDYLREEGLFRGN